MHHVYRCYQSSATNHLTDPKDHGGQDNRCIFWHCYGGTTLYNWTKCFSKPVADGDKRGWHYTWEINMGVKSVIYNFVAISEGGDITGGKIAGDHCIHVVFLRRMRNWA